MPLISSTTNLKSLKYGRDTVGGGNSNQPYVRKAIPQTDPANPYSMDGIGITGGLDIINRGGTLTISRTADDVERLSKFFTDFKTFQGPAFTAKQNLLSATAVPIQAGTSQAPTRLNAGAYSFTSTIAQAGGVAEGLHLNKQGLTAGLTGTERTYINLKKDPGYVDRLELFYNNSIDKASGLELYNYKGGPAQNKFGLGKTFINMEADQRTGLNSNKAKDASFDYDGTRFRVTGKDTVNLDNAALLSKMSITQAGLSDTQIGLVQATNSFTNPYGVNSRNLLVSSPANKATYPNTVLTPEQIAGTAPADNVTVYQGSTPATVPNFKSLIPTLRGGASNYAAANRDNKFTTGDPGSRLINKNADPTSAKRSVGTDLVNWNLFYTGTEKRTGQGYDDFIPFYIKIYEPDSQTDSVFIHFRAFIDSFQDSYGADWKSFKHLGRGEDFYTYQGISRGINLSFTVHAQSKAEIVRQYRKLNRLASSLAPDYSGEGFMRGNFVELTFGDYIKEVPGIITDLTYTVPVESPFEIGRDLQGNDLQAGDKLPHIIQVSSFAFKPIHSFIPEYRKPFISAAQLGTVIVEPGLRSLPNEQGQNV